MAVRETYNGYQLIIYKKYYTMHLQRCTKQPIKDQNKPFCLYLAGQTDKNPFFIDLMQQNYNSHCFQTIADVLVLFCFSLTMAANVFKHKSGKSCNSFIICWIQSCNLSRNLQYIFALDFLFKKKTWHQQVKRQRKAEIGFD